MNEPRFIEAHRLSPFPNRSIDIGVVLDLMIHDLEIILHLVRSEIDSIDAVGVPVLTPSRGHRKCPTAICKRMCCEHHRQSNQPRAIAQNPRLSIRQLPFARLYGAGRADLLETGRTDRPPGCRCRER